MNNHYQSGRRRNKLKGFPYISGIIRGGKIYLTPYDLFEEGSTHGTSSFWLGRTGGYYKSIKFGDIIKKTPLFSGKFDIELTNGTSKQSFSVYDIGEITPKYQTVEISSNDAYTFDYYTGKISGNKLITNGITKALTVPEGDNDVGGIVVPTYHSYYLCRTQTISTKDKPLDIPDFAKGFPDAKFTDRQKFMLYSDYDMNNTSPYELDLVGAIAPSILNTKNKIFENADEFMFWNGTNNYGGYITGIRNWSNSSRVENLEDSFDVWGFGYRIAGTDADDQIPSINYWLFPLRMPMYTEDGQSFSEPWGMNANLNAMFSNISITETPKKSLVSIGVGRGDVSFTEGNTTYNFGRICTLTGLTFIDNFERAVRNIE